MKKRTFDTKLTQISAILVVNSWEHCLCKSESSHGQTQLLTRDRTEAIFNATQYLSVGIMAQTYYGIFHLVQVMSWVGYTKLCLM